MMSSRILIVGSLNIDMILKIDRMPETGENLFARQFVPCYLEEKEITRLSLVHAWGSWCIWLVKSEMMILEHAFA